MLVGPRRVRIVVHLQRVLPSSSTAASNSAMASPIQPTIARALATIGSASISSPSLVTSPALVATIVNILAMTKSGAIKVG